MNSPIHLKKVELYAIISSRQKNSNAYIKTTIGWGKYEYNNRLANKNNYSIFY